MSFTDEQMEAIRELDRLGELTDADKAKINGILIEERAKQSPATIPQPSAPGAGTAVGAPSEFGPVGTNPALIEQQKQQFEQQRLDATKPSLPEAAEGPVGAVEGFLTGAASTLGGAVEAVTGPVGDRREVFDEKVARARQSSPAATQAGQIAPTVLAAALPTIKLAQVAVKGLKGAKAIKKATALYSKLPPSVKTGLSAAAFLKIMGL